MGSFELFTISYVAQEVAMVFIGGNVNRKVTHRDSRKVTHPKIINL
jgi:hypothetical protein